MKTIKVHKWTVAESELQNTDLAAAQAKFPHIDKRVVAKAWGMVNPEREKPQTQPKAIAAEKGEAKEK